MSLVVAFVRLAAPLALVGLATQRSSASDQDLPVERPMFVRVGASEITALVGSRRVLCYRYSDAPFKPYVRELYSPRGVNVLRDAPQDHAHHHGLMFAVAANDVTFWAEEPGAGRQMHTNTTVEVRDDVAGFSALLPWVVDSRVILRERRRIDVLRPPVGRPVTLLTWRSQLTPDGEVTLSGAHYYGLGMRFAASMDNAGEFTYASGAPGEVFRGDERLTRANWCACTGEIDGRQVTVAMFDHPANARHPATWFTMATPFAYMSATMSLHTEPLTLKEGQNLDLWYGVAVWDGRVDSARIEETYRYWLTKSPRDGLRGEDEDGDK